MFQWIMLLILLHMLLHLIHLLFNVRRHLLIHILKEWFWLSFLFILSFSKSFHHLNSVNTELVQHFQVPKERKSIATSTWLKWSLFLNDRKPVQTVFSFVMFPLIASCSLELWFRHYILLKWIIKIRLWVGHNMLISTYIYKKKSLKFKTLPCKQKTFFNLFFFLLKDLRKKIWQSLIPLFY